VGLIMICHNPEMNDQRISIINFDDNWKSQYKYAKPEYLIL